MPPKKPPLKKRTTTRKKNSRSAPAPMPSLIFKEGRLPEEAPFAPRSEYKTELVFSTNEKIEPTKPSSPAITVPLFSFSPQEKTTRRWMWIGVIGLSAIIFILWGWAVVVRLSGIQLNRVPELALANKTKTDWNQIFDDQKKTQTDQALAKAKIRHVLAELMAQSIASTTAANNSISSSIIEQPTPQKLNYKP